MSAEPRVLKTEAEQTLAEQYRAVRDALPGGPKVRQRRDEVMAVFERLGLPHRRVEAWKYTDLRASMRRAAALAPAPTLVDLKAAEPGDPLSGLDRYRLVIANGRVQDESSDRGALTAAGVQIATLAEAFGRDDEHALRLLRADAGGREDAMVALNAALASDGVTVAIPDGVRLERPIEIVHLTAAAVPASWHARSGVVVGAGAEVRLIVSHRGPNGLAYQASSFVGMEVGAQAKAIVVDLQAEGDEAQHIATFEAKLGIGATLDHLAVTAGAKLSRLQGFIAIEGEGARLGAAAATMLGARQHGDVALSIDHRTPGAQSRVVARNAVDGEADGAFQGLIVVRPAAQKTDGRMMVRSLLLSETAEFAAKPELEIYADDVQCGHGATSGRIDEAMLFYFLSRGIPRAEAEKLLLTSFLAEAVEALGDAEIAAVVEPVIIAWLERRPAIARLR